MNFEVSDAATANVCIDIVQLSMKISVIGQACTACCIGLWFVWAAHRNCRLCLMALMHLVGADATYLAIAKVCS